MQRQRSVASAITLRIIGTNGNIVNKVQKLEHRITLQLNALVILVCIDWRHYNRDSSLAGNLAIVRFMGEGMINSLLFPL
jgi:hypothetical protein